MYCPKCGAEQTNEGKFCYKCGSKIIRENEAEANINNNEIYTYVDDQNISSNKNDSKIKYKKSLIYSIIVLVSVVILGTSIFIYKYTISKDASSQNPLFSDSKESIEEQLKSVIKLNLKANQDENLDQYLSTVIIPDEQISQTEEAMTKLFNDYDLQYIIDDIKVLTTDNDDAQVQVVQTTKKLKGGAFRDNKVTVVHHLKKSKGQWKIFKSDTKNIEYFVEDELKVVINSNAQALQEENLDKYLSTMILTDEQTSQIKETMPKLFQYYDLQYTIEDLKVLTTDSNDAQVQVVQTTKKLQGGAFRDNKLTAIHHLKQSDGQWKIFKTDTKNIEYINEKSSTQQENTKNSSLNQEQATEKAKKVMNDNDLRFASEGVISGNNYIVQGSENPIGHKGYFFGFHGGNILACIVDAETGHVYESIDKNKGINTIKIKAN